MRSRWGTIQLGQFTDFRNGLNFTQQDRGHDIKVVGIPDFWKRNEIRDFSSIRSVSLSCKPSVDDLLRDGDLLFVRSNGNKALVGRCMLVFPGAEIASFSVFCIRGRINSATFDPYFVGYLFQSNLFKKHLLKEGTGTNISNLNQDLLSRFSVPMAPLVEQERIAEILRTWDETIDKTERLIAAKEKRIRGLMDNALTAPHDAGDWIRTTLGEVLSVATRRVVWDEEATYRLITVKRACGGIVFRGDRKGSEILTKDMYLVRAADFVISRRQVVHGAWAMAAAQFDGAHVSKEYACLVAKPDRLWMPYFDWLSRTPQVRHLSFICSYCVDIEKMVLNLDWLLQSKIVIPRSIAKQKQIAAALDCGDQEAQLLRQHLTALQKQKRGLMQKLLTGEWPVPLRDSDVDALTQRIPQEAAE